MTRLLRPFTAVAIAMLVAGAGSVASADVRFTLRDGLVSIVVTDATMAEILEEWAKVGQTTVINADRLPGERITLELRDVIEGQALDVILRNAGGYVAVNRAVPLEGASRFDRILVMPPSAIVAAPPVLQRAAASAPARATYQPPPVDPPPYAVESAPADDPPDDAPADQEVVIVGTAIAPVEGAGAAAVIRQAAEVIDPRTFKLPPQPRGAAVSRRTPTPRVKTIPLAGFHSGR